MNSSDAYIMFANLRSVAMILSMETIAFASARSFRTWLSKNHKSSEGIWLQIFKKNSDVASVTYAEAIDQALCFGWIDGQKKPFDEDSWLQRFTPRRAKSIWSAKNTSRAEKLIKSGDMNAAGLKEIEAAKADGRWKKAYASSKNAEMPADFLKELSKNKKAQKFFETLNKTNLFSIYYRLHTAKKPETRERRMKEIIQMLATGEKFH
jgi:uncharacterized protein YdeI (YjbR/CyaY-like superfamily)